MGHLYLEVGTDFLSRTHGTISNKNDKYSIQTSPTEGLTYYPPQQKRKDMVSSHGGTEYRGEKDRVRLGANQSKT